MASQLRIHKNWAGGRQLLGLINRCMDLEAVQEEMTRVPRVTTPMTSRATVTGPLRECQCQT
jgi:hypothetical protein